MFPLLNLQDMVTVPPGATNSGSFRVCSCWTLEPEGKTKNSLTERLLNWLTLQKHQAFAKPRISKSNLSFPSKWISLTNRDQYCEEKQSLDHSGGIWCRPPKTQKNIPLASSKSILYPQESWEQTLYANTWLLNYFLQALESTETYIQGKQLQCADLTMPLKDQQGLYQLQISGPEDSGGNDA